MTQRMYALRSLVLLMFLLAIGSGVLRPASANAEKLVIFAAASLNEAFTEIGRNFEGVYPGNSVIFNFAGSQTIRTKLEQGAQADLFASADNRVMVALRKGKLIASEEYFAENSLVLIVARDSRGLISDLFSTTKPKRLLAIGTSDSPIGAYTRQMLESLARDPAYGPDFTNAFMRNVVSEEMNVKAILAKVTLGEVDGGIVYQTDLTPPMKDRVYVLPLPTAHLPTVRYPIAQVMDSPRQALGERFIRYLLSPAGQQILQRHGFLSVREAHDPS